MRPNLLKFTVNVGLKGGCGTSNPGCQIVGSVASTLLTTEADDKSSRHCSDMSTDVMCDKIY